MRFSGLIRLRDLSQCDVVGNGTSSGDMTRIQFHSLGSRALSSVT